MTSTQENRFRVETRNAEGTIDEVEAETLEAGKKATQTLFEDLGDRSATAGVWAVVIGTEDDERIVWVTRDGRSPFAATGVRTMPPEEFREWLLR